MIALPNIILIAGSGRNVGKTLLACKLIHHFSRFHQVTAIKMSPHFHELDKNDEIMHQTQNFSIIKETQITNKDSSRMMQAGANESYFIQYKDHALEEAYHCLFPTLNKKRPIICESGELQKIIEPALFLYVSNNKEAERKQKKSILIRSSDIPDINIDFIQFMDGKFTISNPKWY